MIEVDISELEKEVMKEINSLANQGTLNLRKGMLTFLKENYLHGSSEYLQILEFINDFCFCGHGGCEIDE